MTVFDPSSSTVATPTEDRFTVKLHKLLEDAETYGFQDIIGWNRDGRSFTIINQEEFAQQIIGQYFRQSKYKSFQRQLNLYDFQRESRNGFRGCYSHPMFIRKDRQMSNQMRRKIMSQKAKKPIQIMGTSTTRTSPQHPRRQTKKLRKGDDPNITALFSNSTASEDARLPPVFIQSTIPVKLNSRELIDVVLQPAPVNNGESLRCYSHNKRDLMDDEESMGTIEGQILDEDRGIYIY